MASGKRSKETDFDYCDVGLGLKLQRQHHHYHHSADEDSPNSKEMNMMMSMPPWQATHGRNSSCTSTSSTCSFMAASGGGSCYFPHQQLSDASSADPSRFGTRVAFTEGQRQELERQTMIYKYMVSSLPVPPELLIPISKASPSEEVGRRMGRTNGSETRGATGGMNRDSEPWRCRRTDGKKWRCSRDVAPDQKYCDRHSHKGRPSRSRKPVESLLLSTSNTTTTTSTNSNASSDFLSSFNLKPSSLSQYHPYPRYPDWFMKKDVVPAVQGLYQQQQQIPEESIGNINYLSQKGACLLPRPFIDAWSLGDVTVPKDPSRSTPVSETISAALPPPNNKSPSSALNSILPLTLSMSAGLDPAHYNTPHDAKDPSVIRDIRSSQQQPLNWMPSWISSPLGGPLAEALCLGMSDHSDSLAAHSDELLSPHANSSSSSATTLGSKGSLASADTSPQGFRLH